LLCVVPTRRLLEPLGTDPRRRLGVDQALDHVLDTSSDDIDVAAGADRIEELV
jgi:hypothetical protein